MKKTSVLNLFVMVLLLSLGVSACKTLNKGQKGVLIGAGAGGAVGAGVGKAAGNTALGAIIGAAVGGATGGVIGRQMDKEAKEIEKISGAEVKRVGEGINVTFKAGVLFGVDKADLTSSAQSKVKELAQVLNKYPDTYVLVEGHTDDTGSDDHNMQLSERRAKEVVAYLRQQGLSSDRLKTAWYGKSQPKVSNATESGRAENRRVEFAIYATEKLVEKAKSDKAL
ncbi:OmpA family protein [Segetibacter sp. 3557_3]|uniref:OmpA family protein n=1 Tax=Segetibacter sp. 3557_3 TaxID=2547429 RepID=UPI00105881B0|nr:OmpA family protein [Segetibacter sp. 3557_3]TDH26209.1 OmpA family protein [Segetibacter sp. 3557_3]